MEVIIMEIMVGTASLRISFSSGAVVMVRNFFSCCDGCIPSLLPAPRGFMVAQKQDGVKNGRPQEIAAGR